MGNPYAKYQGKSRAKGLTKEVLNEREIVFLGNYYGLDSPTKGKRRESAIAAGITSKSSDRQAKVIINKYENCSFQDSCKALGLTKPYLAMKLRQVLDKGGEKEILASVRLVLANLGEATDESKGSGTNVFTGPVMLIQGMTPGKLNALRRATPQLSPEQQEALEEQQYQERKEKWNRGELPPIPSHSKATTGYTGWNENDPQVAISDVQSGADGSSGET